MTLFIPFPQNFFQDSQMMAFEEIYFETYSFLLHSINNLFSNNVTFSDKAIKN